MTKDEETQGLYKAIAIAVLSSVGLSTGIQYKTDLRKDPYTGAQGKAVEARVDTNHEEIDRLRVDNKEISELLLLSLREMERIKSEQQHVAESLATCRAEVSTHNKKAQVWIRQIEDNKRRIEYYLGTGGPKP